MDLGGLPLKYSPADLSMIYGELRSMARAHMAGERPDHTFQPTALVHEVYLRLANRTSIQEKDQLLALASRVMRHVLVDYARKRRSYKRGALGCRVTLDEDMLSLAPNIDLLILDEALTDLASMDPRQARIVELRVFGGMTLDEVAALLEISSRTVKRDWVMARAWLERRFRQKAS